MGKYLKFCFGSISVLPFDTVVIEMWFGTAACPAVGTAHLTSVPLDYRLDSVLLPAASSVSQTAVDAVRRCCPLLPRDLFRFVMRRLHCADANLPVGYLISWRQHVPQKHRYVQTRVHGVTLHVTAELCAMKRHDVGSPEVHLSGKWWQAAFCFVIALADGCSSRQVAH